MMLVPYMELKKGVDETPAEKGNTAPLYHYLFPSLFFVSIFIGRFNLWLLCFRKARFFLSTVCFSSLARVDTLNLHSEFQSVYEMRRAG